MVADIFELNGWDSHFLGANTPFDQMLAYIQDESPDLVGLSVSVYFNMPALKPDRSHSVRFRTGHPGGGQAFHWGEPTWSNSSPRPSISPPWTSSRP